MSETDTAVGLNVSVRAELLIVTKRQTDTTQMIQDSILKQRNIIASCKTYKRILCEFDKFDNVAVCHYVTLIVIVHPLICCMTMYNNAVTKSQWYMSTSLAATLTVIKPK